MKKNIMVCNIDSLIALKNVWGKTPIGQLHLERTHPMDRDGMVVMDFVVDIPGPALKFLPFSITVVSMENAPSKPKTIYKTIKF